MNRILKHPMILAALSLSALSLSGCGQKIVKGLSFTATETNGQFIAGFDTRVEVGSGSLPEAKLPVYDPKSPANFLGYIESHYDGTLSVRVDLTQALKIKTTDGSLLPNGRELPVVLPSGVTSVAIPVINSKSKVYVALGQKNIMAGVAVTLVADTSSSNAEWLKVLRSLPTNLFYPFNISSDVKGNAGIFTGDQVGVAVFAVKSQDTTVVPSLATSVPVISNPEFFRRGLSIASATYGSAPAVSTTPEFFDMRTQSPSGSKLRKIQRALDQVRRTKID